VLINLLENATKYSPPGSEIVVSARVAAEGAAGTAPGSAIEVEVADRGAGVAAADAERIFDKFYRVREGEGGGVGLGLAICRGIVNAHGGRIWVEEREGGGARFRFRIPLLPVAEPAGMERGSR
jgi:two-component system sensor histidine kinase KdpD